MSFYRPTYYGITGADNAYVAAHNLTPDATGKWPRLDREGAGVELVKTVDGFVRVDCPEQVLNEAMTDALAVYQNLLALHRSRFLGNAS